MPAENKKKKLVNSYGVKGWLKNRSIKLKGAGFYNSSVRQKNKRVTLTEE